MPVSNTLPRRPNPSRWRARATRLTAAIVGIVAISGLSWSLLGRWHDGADSAAAHTLPGPTGPSVTKVDVVAPRPGGIPRLTTQPGTIHAFESVDLLAKVSGFLKTQSVDIGSPVKAGQVLAEIDAPEILIDVVAAEAALAQTRAQEEQALARVRTSEAERVAADAAVVQAKADLERLVARRSLTEKQFERIRALSARKAVDDRLVDEQQHDLEASRAGERAGQAAIGTAEAQAAAAGARVLQSRADADEAKAAVQVALAHLDRAKATADFTRIVAPFDGVVVKRGLHPGAFVRSAAEGGTAPLLTVMRTDLMRVVVQVPDLDVPLLDAGDPASVEIDALKARPIEGEVARLARAEDPTTRTMRAEFDVPNPTGKIVEGMFGRVTIQLQPPSGRLTVPSGCIAQHLAKDQAVAFVSRDGKAAKVKVEIGTDDGSRVEVLSGLGLTDHVVVRPPGSLADGDDVEENPISEGEKL